MVVKLLDFRGKERSFNIGELKDISNITMSVITGDEIMLVKYKDYRTFAKIDTGTMRMYDFYDNTYVVYDEEAEINLFNNKAFMNRKTSYWNM